MRIWRACGMAAALGLTFLVSGAACIISVEPGDDDNDGGNGDPPEVLTVRILNATNVGLDPEIYTSAEPVSAEELFSLGVKYTDFGFLNLGFLDRGDSAEFDIACSDALVLGTLGGSFGEDPVNNPEGNGTQIVLSQDVNIFCGGTVVFTYSRAANGFRTSFAVNP